MPSRNNTDQLVDLEAVECVLLDARDVGLRPNAVFILGAPRTGSTVLYQAMANAFRLPFISNFTNAYFSEAPIIGLAIQNGMDIEIGFESTFGKTAGQFQPSEGSAVMTNWFGGGHPSQLVSTRIREGQQQHFFATLAATEALSGAPLLIKNAWHCFRVPWLANALPEARFIWIRRDIRDAALSDLDARYKTKGDPSEWNSATPANVDQLRKRSPLEQVVENQFEFNNAISSAITQHAPNRAIEVWYEDFVARPAVTLENIGALIGMRPNLTTSPPRIGNPSLLSLAKDQCAKLEAYVSADRVKFEGHFHHTRGKRS